MGKPETSQPAQKFIESANDVQNNAALNAQGQVLGYVLKAGSIIHIGGKPVELKTDAVVAFAGMEREQSFVGLIYADAINFQLNAPGLKGKYSPLNAALVPNECENCGKALPFEAADQKTCSSVCADVLRTKETGSPLTAESQAISDAGVAPLPVVPGEMSDVTEATRLRASADTLDAQSPEAKEIDTARAALLPESDARREARRLRALADALDEKAIDERQSRATHEGDAASAPALTATAPAPVEAEARRLQRPMSGPFSSGLSDPASPSLPVSSPDERNEFEKFGRDPEIIK